MTALTLLQSSTLTQYLAEVKAIPSISADEEYILFKQYHDKNCLQSMHKIITSHLRFVVYIAKQYINYNVPLVDLIQEGNIGLMKAAKSFKLDTGARFVSYAVSHIKASIYKFVADNFKLIKFTTTKSRRKLFFNKSSVYSIDGSVNKITDVAKELNVPEKDVVEYINYMHIDNIPLYNDDGTTIEYAYDSYIDNEIDLQHKEYVYKQLHEGISQLSEREQIIIKSRILDDNKKTLHELAEIFGVSYERIRQNEVNALKKLKNILKDVDCII